MNGVAADGLVDRSPTMTRQATDDGEVGFLDLAFGKGRGQRCMNPVVLGHDDASARFLVESVDNAGAMLLRSGRE